MLYPVELGVRELVIIAEKRHVDKAAHWCHSPRRVPCMPGPCGWNFQPTFQPPHFDRKLMCASTRSDCDSPTLHKALARRVTPVRC